jgi:hypothetical protein
LLRHAFARSCLINGGDVYSLQPILGHTTLDMVKRDVVLADGDVAAGIGRVARRSPEPNRHHAS